MLVTRRKAMHGIFVSVDKTYSYSNLFEIYTESLVFYPDPDHDTTVLQDPIRSKLVKQNKFEAVLWIIFDQVLRLAACFPGNPSTAVKNEPGNLLAALPSPFAR